MSWTNGNLKRNPGPTVRVNLRNVVTTPVSEVEINLKNIFIAWNKKNLRIVVHEQINLKFLKFEKRRNVNIQQVF